MARAIGSREISSDPEQKQTVLSDKEGTKIPGRRYLDCGGLIFKITNV